MGMPEYRQLDKINTNVNSVINQKIKEKFVEREIIYCVSSLIYEMAQDNNHMDELMGILSQDDYEEPAKDFIDTEITIDQCAEYIEAETELLGDFSKGTLKGLKGIVSRYLEEQANYHEFCELFDIEPERHEALEHWIVSDYLADKLRKKGEMVIDDFMGLTIWGRCTSGQHILLDGVISEICSDIGILDGQRYSWAPEKNTEPDIKRLRQVRDALNKTKNRDKIEQIASILEV